MMLLWFNMFFPPPVKNVYVKYTIKLLEKRNSP